MIDIVVLTVFTVIALTAYAFFMHNFVVSMKISDINLYSFSLYYSTLIFLAPGTVIIASGIFPDLLYYRVVSDTARNLAFWSFLASFYIFLASTMLLSKAFGRPDINVLRNKAAIRVSKKTEFVLYSIFTISIVLFIYVALLLRGDIPILHLIQGDILAANTLRVQNKFTYGNFVYNILAQYLIPLCAIIFFVVTKVSPRKRYRRLFLISLALAVLYSVHAVEKSPIFQLFISLILIQIFFSGFKPRYFLYAAMILGCAVISYGLTRTFGFDDLDYLLYRVSNRIFISQAGGMFLAFEWFPDVLTTPMALQGLPTIVTELFDVPRYNSAREIMVYLQGHDADIGVHNSHYIGGAWASFNILGLVVAPIIVAINYFAFHKLCERFPNSIAVIAPAFYFTFVLIFSPHADYRAFAYFIILQVPILIWLLLFSIKLLHEFLVFMTTNPARQQPAGAAQAGLRDT